MDSDNIKETRYWIFIGLAVIWMAVIFINSSLKGSASSGLSESIIGILVSISKWFGDGYSVVRLRAFIRGDFFHLFIRKTAHFIEFGILGLLVAGALGILKNIRHMYVKRALLAAGFSFIYAISDEFHQFFVEGRVCSASDVLIDTAGALAFTLTAAYILLKLNAGKREKDNEKN